MQLPEKFRKKYEELAPEIRNRLKEFECVPPEKYFYEICFCICTPQSSAQNAFKVVEKLEQIDFQNKAISVGKIIGILRAPSHYIRFHKTKAQHLIEMKKQYSFVSEILGENISPQEKRIRIKKLVKGFGMKESSHFLRNIGYKNLAILDRHILRSLVLCGVFEAVPKIHTDGRYLEIEAKFLEFSSVVGISMDELDLLFWASETGKILK